MDYVRTEDEVGGNKEILIYLLRLPRALKFRESVKPTLLNLLSFRGISDTNPHLSSEWRKTGDGGDSELHLKLLALLYLADTNPQTWTQMSELPWHVPCFLARLQRHNLYFAKGDK